MTGTPEQALRAVVAALPKTVTGHRAIGGRLTAPDLLVVSNAFTKLPGQAPQTQLTVGAGRTTATRHTLVSAAATGYPAPVHPVRIPRPVARVIVTAEHLDVPAAEYTGAPAEALARAVDNLTAPSPGPRSCPGTEIEAPPRRLTLTLGSAEGPVTVVVRADGCTATSIA